MFQNFIIAGRAGGWSDATARQYEKHLAYWQSWMGDKPITPQTLQTWVVEIRGKWQPATVRAAVIAVRGWLRYTDRPELAAVLKPPTPPARVQRTVSAAEVSKLLETAERPVCAGLSPQAATTASYRNAAIIAVLYDAWLRASEVCALTIDAVSVEARRLIVEGKGDREELVAFSADTALRLRLWLDVRGTVANRGVLALFVGIGGNTPGEAMTAEGLRAMLKSVGRRAGVADLSPHAFRRGGATQAIRQGASTRWVQAHGRWAKLEMVERYTRALDPGDMIDEYSPMRSLNNRRPVTLRELGLDL